MNYSISYTTKDEHIDTQNIMDGLYYPFYLEDCRHNFVKDILGFDIEQAAKEGVNMVLTQYSIKFLRPLKKGDRFEVTCNLLSDKSNKPIFYFRQTITLNNKVMTEATFHATCIRVSGGRPFIPDSIIIPITSAPALEN